MLAALSRNTDMVRYMLEKGGDVNARDTQGKAVIAFVRDSSAIRALLERAGAHP